MMQQNQPDIKESATSNTGGIENQESPIIVGLEIRTTKVAVIAGRKNEQGKLEILGYGKANSKGVQHGDVLNIDLTIKSIQQALHNCLKSNPQLLIEEVYVGISGKHIKSLQTRGDIVRQDAETEIQKREIDQLIADQRRTFIPASDEIIDLIPQDFKVDKIQNIKDPVGYNGVKVGANFHLMTGDKNAIRNINRAVLKSGLLTKDLVVQPLASSAAVMSDIDLEAGVAILDIGSGTSDLAIFYEGIVKHTAVIPFGGENITHDIRMGLGVLKQQAEALKVQFGCAIADEAKSNTYITIPGLKGLPAKEISMRNLAQIIQARRTEILEFISFHIKQIGLDENALNGGIILTGGGSQLKDLRLLTEYVTRLNDRIGYPNEHLAPNQIAELRQPMYATCLGLILKGYNDYESKSKEFSKQTSIVQVPEGLISGIKTEVSIENTAIRQQPGTIKEGTRFWDKFKNSIIELFKEEDDPIIK
jgi:cell division protein FtsA